MTGMSLTGEGASPPTPKPLTSDGPGLGAGDLSGEVLTSAHAQARQRAESGDLNGARTLLEEALATGELQFGRDHPQLAPLMVDLATIARNVGNLTEAQNQLRRAYGIVVAAAGPEHATALSIEGRLAAVSYRLGEPTEAYDWHIADVGARVLGSEHPAVRGAQQRLAANPIQEERTPPTEPPVAWQSYAGSGGFADAPAADLVFPALPGEEGGGWAPGYASFVPSSTEVGIYRGLPPAGFTTTLPELPRRPYTPVEYPEPAPEGQRRGHAGGVALVTSFGLAILLAAVVIAYQLFGAHGAASTGANSPSGTQASSTSPAAQSGSPAPSDSASASPSVVPGLPPENVTLQDNGGSVTVTWVDPSYGHIPFVIAVGRQGVTPVADQAVAAGQTTETIYGLNPSLNYCFTVTAIWSAELTKTSAPVCTNRASTPTPT
jgi:hypothetical protein